MLATILGVVTVALSLGKAIAEVQLKGVNIAGFEFGCVPDGSCIAPNSTPPFLSPGKWALPRISKFNFYSDGIGQMEHFSKADGMNIYRLPVSWQFLTNYTLGGELEYNHFGIYNELVQGCLKTGSYCIIDIHNYARWEGSANIIGQGGPTNEHFASVWRKLAQVYKKEKKIVFGLMNEPHNLDMKIWSDTCQYVVNAIRNAGAESQMIFLPGTMYANALGFEEHSGPALSQVRNPDGSNHNLIYEVHRYFGQNKVFNGQCISDHIEDAFQPLADYLRKTKRIAFFGELGGGANTTSCLRDVCNALAFINSNSDVFLGFTAWSAGSFRQNYPYILVPKGSAKEGWVDQPLLTECFAKNFEANAKKNTVKNVKSQ